MPIKSKPTMLNGINPLSYVGVNPYTPPGMYQLPRDPTVRDNAGFQIGDYWMNSQTNDLWYLAQKNISGAPEALWILLGKGPSIRTLTGDVGGPVGPDINGNINTFGTAGEILVTGNPATNTLTWSLVNPCPPQSAFGAGISANITNATGAGALYDIIFDDAYYNLNGNYDSSTGIYTAPYTTIYQFNSSVSLIGLDHLMGSVVAGFVVAGTGPCVGTWSFVRNNPYATEENVTPNGVWRHNGSHSLFLNAGDTVKVQIQVEGGAADTATIFEGGSILISETLFTGFNMCGEGSAPPTPSASFPANTGVAIPVLGVTNILGATYINTTGFGNTIEIEATEDVAASFPCDTGTAIPAANTLNILGGNGITTEASPNLSNNVIINAAAGSVAFAATISADIPNATGLNAYTIVFDTLIWDVNSGFDTTTGRFTAPSTGLYAFQSTVGLISLTVADEAVITSFPVAGTGPCVGAPGAFVRAAPYTCADNASGVFRINGATTYFLNAGDIVSVVVHVFGAGVSNTVTVYRGGGAPYNGTWFTGYKIS